MIKKTVNRRADGVFEVRAVEMSESAGRELRRAAGEALDAGATCIAVDLDRVEHLTRDGAHALLFLARDVVRRQAVLTLGNARPSVAERLRALGVERLAAVELRPRR